MVERGAEGERGDIVEGELTIEEFLALLRYINDKIEMLTKELARYQKHSRRMHIGAGGFEDLVRAIIATSVGQPSSSYTPPEVDEELREKVKKLARKLAGNVSSGK